MASLRVASGDALQRIKFHSENMYREVRNSLTFNSLTAGKDTSSFIKMNQPPLNTGFIQSFSHGKGTGIKDRFAMSLKLENAPVKNGSRDLLTGQEEALTINTFDHELDMYEQEVAAGTILSDLRSFVDLHAESRRALTDHITDQIDTLYFDALYTDSAPTDFVFQAFSTDDVTTATSEPAAGAVTADATLTPQYLARISQIARTGDSDSGVTNMHRMEKVAIAGVGKVFVLLVPPTVATELRINADYADYRKRVEVLRGTPIFDLAVAQVEDILIIESEKVAKDTTNSIARCTLLGKSGLVVSLARPEGMGVVIKEVTKNAGREDYLIGRWFVKVSKPKFNNSEGTLKDYGSLSVLVRYGK